LNSSPEQFSWKKARDCGINFTRFPKYHSGSCNCLCPLRLSGYKALLDFDTNFVPESKAKYDGMKLGSKTVVEVGAQFNAEWTKDEKLELSAADNVYVAREFAHLRNGEFVSGRGKETIQDLGDKWIKPYVSHGK